MTGSRCIAALGMAIVAACSSVPDEDTAEGSEAMSDTVAPRLPAGTTMAEAATQACSTVVARRLSAQLIDEIDCLKPGVLVSIARHRRLEVDPAAFLVLQAPAAEALSRALDDAESTWTLTSALRTLPQQFMLAEWAKRRSCGTSLAASPGSSKHESGLAIDVSAHHVPTWRDAKSRLSGNGFEWFGERDKVHFTYVGEGTVDLESLSVQAFQGLWNRNHPDDTIEETGTYDDETARRLKAAPAAGFRLGAACSSDLGSSVMNAD